MGEYYQRDFRGGLDVYSKDTDVAPNGYVALFNGRTRRGAVESINKSQDITYNLHGKFQGIYGVGSVWITFFSGNAYYMPIGGTQWFQVPFFSMDADVSYIYACPVPGTNNNYLRQAILTQQVNADGTVTAIVNAAAGIIKTSPFSVSGIPGGLIVQDGINQPWILTYDVANNNVTARILGTYSQWDNTGTTSNNMEYVPIGQQMMYLNGILYIVAPNGYEIYRSVSGSPLNFMVNIDTNGNKLATEALGGAETVSFAMDFDTITCLIPYAASSVPDSFIVGTANNVYCLNADFTTTIFGEPTFDKQFQLVLGIVNQFCVSDANGDTLSIDFNGVKSWNGVQQLKFRGNNTPLSKNIDQLLTGITQNVCCSTTFDNYNLFSLKTSYGYVVAVYDNMQQLWVGTDINSSTISGIQMFAQAFLPDQQFLAAGTQDGYIWLMYSVDNDNPTTDRECCTLISKAFITGDYFYGTFYPGELVNHHKSNFVKAAIYDPTVSDTLTLQEYVDYKRGIANNQPVIISQPISGIISGIDYPVFPPVMANNKKRAEDKVFTLNNGMTGYKLQYVFSWQSDLRLERFDVNTTEVVKQQADDQVKIARPI